MKLSALPMLAACLFVIPLQATERSPIPGHIEFLWEASEPGSDVRAVALGLLTQPDRPHRLCWKSTDFPGALVRLDIHDGTGTLVESHDSSRGGPERSVTECRDFVPGDLNGEPGIWRFDLYFDAKLAATARIEVADSLEQAQFHDDPERPYVVGRTNYPEGIEPADYNGHFLWTLTFDETGKVTEVQIREMSGIAEQLRETGLRAARLNRIPADPTRIDAPYRANQRYDFSSD